MFNYYKSVHYPIPTLLKGTGSTLVIFKINQLSFQICSFLPKLKRKERPFWKGARRGTTLQDYDLVDIRDEKASPFVKFEIILPLIKLKCSSQNLLN